MVAVEPPEWLPPGFMVKIKYRDGRKVKHYLNVATGKKYNSKKEVIRCATEDNSLLVTPQAKNRDDNVQSLTNKVDVIADKTNDWLPNGWIVEERKRKRGPTYKVYTNLSSGSKFYSKAAVIRYLSTIDHADTMTKQNKNDNVDDPCPDMSLQVLPVTGTGKVRGKKREANSFVKIDNVGELLQDMSSQGISKTNANGVRGKKRKRNSFVTVSVETSTPHDLPSGWIKEIKTSKSGSKMRQDPFYTDPISGNVFRSKPDALRYLKTNDIHSCICRPLKRNSDDIKVIEKITPSSNPAPEKKHLLSAEEPNDGEESASTKSPSEPEAKISKQNQANHNNIKVLEERVSCEDAEMGDNPKPGSDLPKNSVDLAIGSPASDPSTKQKFPESGSKCKTGPQKSKKRSGTSLPLRTSKRLSGSEPEMQSILDSNKLSRRAAKGSKVDTEAVDHAVVAVESRQVEEPEKASEKPLDNVHDQWPQDLELCYDFGDSWSDPLEFALKTLTGEIPIDDTLTFPSCFDNPCLDESQFDAPINFRGEFAASESESVDNLAKSECSKGDDRSASFFGLGSFGLGCCKEGDKKDSETKFKP